VGLLTKYGGKKYDEATGQKKKRRIKNKERKKGRKRGLLHLRLLLTRQDEAGDEKRV
jgi:hypothetical protein